jgi:hypothetical protein
MTRGLFVSSSFIAHDFPFAAPAKVKFNRDVRPILSDKCFFCHGPDPKKREADLRLDERDAAVEAKAIVPGKAEVSEMIQRILTTDARRPHAAGQVEARRPHGRRNRHPEAVDQRRGGV